MSFYNYISKLIGYGVNGLSMDRIDVNGNYEPGNVRFVDQHFQCVNARRFLENDKYMGVNIRKEVERWRSSITVYGNVIIIGYYDTEEEGAEARDEYIIENELWEYPLQSKKYRNYDKQKTQIWDI